MDTWYTFENAISAWTGTCGQGRTGKPAFFGKPIYESVNSQGFTEPFVYMPTDDPSIIAIYRVRVYVEGILEDRLVCSPYDQCSSMIPDGSKPTYSMLEFLKLLRNVPSFEPISINFESDFKNSLFIQSAYFLKCSFINSELPV